MSPESPAPWEPGIQMTGALVLNDGDKRESIVVLNIKIEVISALFVPLMVLFYIQTRTSLAASEA